LKKKEIRTFSSDQKLVRQRRREIAEKAITLFMKKGYLKTSTREIAEICGMSTGGLYHYIGSKEDILSIFSEGAFSILEEISKKYFNPTKPIRPREKLKLALTRYLKWIDEVQDVVLFYYQESKNLPKDALIRVMSSDALSIKIIEEILVEGSRQGEFDVPDPVLAANNIIVLCDTWAFRRWFLRKHFTFKEFNEKQVDFILRSVSAK